jgi:uncharacterized protein (DUF1800 family)
MAGPLLDKNDVVHLLSRAAFGVRSKEWKRYVDLDRDAAVARVIGAKPIKGLGPTRDMETYQKWWLKKMASSRHGFREKLALFWHDHFAVSQLEIGSSASKTTTGRMRKHIQTLRLFGAGSFRDLILEVTRDQAMLRFLDNGINKANELNENYGRELQELFVLGVFDLNGQPNYTQTDVIEMSRSLTGFDNSGNFRESRHDAGIKTLFAGEAFEATGALGVVEVGDGFVPPLEQVPLPAARNIIEILLSHRDSDGRPTAGRFIARKLWEWYAYPDPDKALVDELADVFTAVGPSGHDYDLMELVRAIFTHDEFWSSTARGSTVKTPAEFAIGAIRALKVSSNFEQLIDQMENMGMQPLVPPNVAGWRHGTAWVGSGPWLARMRFAQDVAAGRDRREYKFRPEKFMPPAPVTSDQVLDTFLDVLGITLPDATEDPGQVVRTALLDYLGAPNYSDPDVIETKVRGLVALLLSLPYYHVH